MLSGTKFFADILPGLRSPYFSEQDEPVSLLSGSSSLQWSWNLRTYRPLWERLARELKSAPLPDLWKNLWIGQKLLKQVWSQKKLFSTIESLMHEGHCKVAGFMHSGEAQALMFLGFWVVSFEESVCWVFFSSLWAVPDSIASDWSQIRVYFGVVFGRVIS